jgi:hypothetical protein
VAVTKGINLALPFPARPDELQSASLRIAFHPAWSPVTSDLIATARWYLNCFDF